MARKEKLKELKNQLRFRRNQTFEGHRKLEDERQVLQQREIEFEDQAQKEPLSLSLEQLDEQEKAELENIDQALGRIETGSYGLCDSCGKTISLKRLEAVPWSTRCTHCAKKEESPRIEASVSPEAEGSDPGEIPLEYQGLSSEEIREHLYDDLRQDRRVDLEELDIAFREGKVYLGGFLPSEAKRQILLEIIQDVLGFQTVDEITVDPLLWQRGDRTPGKEAVPETEDPGQGPYMSSQSGIPMIPPDELIPEKENR